EIVAKVALLATNAVRIARVAAVAADSALNVAAEAISQVAVHDGRIDQPWMRPVAGAAAVLGEVPGALGSRAFRGEKEAAKIIDTANDDSAVAVDGKQVPFADDAQSVSSKPVGEIPAKSDTGIAASIKNVDT